MGKALFLLVGAFGLFTAFNMMSTDVYVNESSSRLAEDQFEILSRNAAVVAEELTVQKLSGGFYDRTFEGVYENIPYEVVADVDGNQVTITVLSTATDSRGTSIPFHIRSSYDRVLSSNIADDVPPFMQYAFISGEDITLSGTISGDVFATGHEASVLNADMHTNGSLFLDGVGSRADEIRGHGTYVGSAEAGQDHFWDRKFRPYYFYEEASNQSVYQVDPVDIPPLTFTFDEEDPSPTVTINGTIRVPLTAVLMPNEGVGTDYYLGANTLEYEIAPSRDHPAFFFVPGNLIITTDVELPSYTLFLVDGTVDFRNQIVTPGPSTYDGGDESTLGFYASQQILTQGNAVVWAQLYSKGGITIGGGQPVVYGNLATWGAVSFNGTLDMKYREASPALTTIWNDDSIIKLRRQTYTEW